MYIHVDVHICSQVRPSKPNVPCDCFMLRYDLLEVQQFYTFLCISIYFITLHNYHITLHYITYSITRYISTFLLLLGCFAGVFCRLWGELPKQHQELLERTCRNKCLIRRPPLYYTPLWFLPKYGELVVLSSPSLPR